MRAGIVTGGTVTPGFIRRYCEEKKIDFWIGADKGMEAFAASGIRPNCLVGDFDSAREEVLAFYRKEDGIEWQVFRPEKDETDTELAIRRALAEKPEEICLFGGTGTRLDHVLGTVHVMKRALDAGVYCEMLDPYNRLYLIDRNRTFYKKELYGPYVSFLPFGGPVHRVTLTGFRYPLREAELFPGSSLTVSNELCEAEGRLEKGEGMLLVAESRDLPLA
ncbi:MAG: thiamine diphosphokinase [Lachnospiraceae bacterium]|nr:thiamine diphosphokinase [Lachnospiraceae bacterium]